MAFRDYTVLAWSPSLDARDGNQTFTSAAQAFAAADEYSSVKRGGVTPTRSSKLQVQGDTLLKGLPAGSVAIDAISQEKNAQPQMITLASGADNISYMVRPIVPTNLITYDVSRSTGPYSTQNVIFDLRKAENSDIVYTSSSYIGAFTSWGNTTLTGTDPAYTTTSTVYANYPHFASVLLGSGSDVVVGGAGMDDIDAADSTSGSKVLIGGSFNDIIKGSSDADYIVGDYHAGSPDAFVNTSLELSAIGKTQLNGQINDQRFATNSELIISTGLDSSRNSERKSRNNRSWLASDDGYYYNRGSAVNFSQNSFTGFTSQRVTSLQSPQTGLYKPREVNTWQPYGDFIVAGAGDDVIFGDDNVWTGQDLINYKDRFDMTLEAINSYTNYYTANWPWRTIVDKTNSVRTYAYDYKLPSWTTPSDPTTSRRLRLGDDEIYGGDGDDVIFGGFGSDLIVGGKGFDVIYAPSQILVPGFDPLWGEATVLYGNEFAKEVDTNGRPTKVLSSYEINAHRYGLDADNQNSNSYKGFASALIPDPDAFVIEAPIFSQARLANYKEDFGQITKELSTSKVTGKFSNQSGRYDDLLKIGETVLVGASYIPVVGDVVGALKDLFGILLDRPNKEELPASLPANSDSYRVIRDFDIWDSIYYVVPDGASSNFSDSGLDLSADAASWYKEQGYQANSIQTADTYIKNVSTEGVQSIVLTDFTFDVATKHFIDCLKYVEGQILANLGRTQFETLPVGVDRKITNYNITDPVTGKSFVYPLQQIRLAANKEFGDFKGASAADKPLGTATPKDVLSLTDALQVISSKWGTRNQDHVYTYDATKDGNSYKVLAHRFFDPVTLASLADIGFSWGV